MINRRTVTIAIALLALLLFVSACGSATSQNSISVYNWGEYIDEDILSMFTQKTGIEVVYDYYANNEEMYAKIKSGGVNYDLCIPSDYMIERMIAEDLLETVDTSQIPNYANIDDRFKDLAYDPENKYSVPYVWGTVGILYNTSMVDDPVDSWDILWNDKYANQIFMYDSMRDTVGVSLKRLGFSLNTRDVSELNQARDELIAQSDLVRAIVGDTVRDSMIGGEAALAVVYSGDALYCIEKNRDLGYAVPKEGSNVWFDAMVVPKGAKNIEGALKFIDFLCDPEICLRNVEYIGFSTVNSETLKLLPEEMTSDPTFWPDDEIYNRCEVFYDLGDFVGEYDRVWTEVLASW